MEGTLTRIGNNMVGLMAIARNLGVDFNDLMSLLMGDPRKFKEGMAIQDRLILEHCDKDGNLLGKRDSGWRNNGLTNVGFAEVAGLILLDVTGQTAFDYIAIGTGVTAFDPTDEALVTETHREAGTGTRITTTVTNDTAQLEYTFSGYGGSEAITESGVFNDATVGIMLCRQTFSALNIDWAAGDTLKVTWKVQCKQGA